MIPAYSQSHDFSELRANIDGSVIADGDSGYDLARTLFNGIIDRRPAAVIQVAGPADVATTINFAVNRGYELSVRGGGHSVSGASMCDGGLAIDLSRLRSIEVDAAARRVRCGGGVTWKELDAATQDYGLAVPGGTVSHTGVGGLTLGGGIGWLTSLFGLTSDNLLSAQVVTAAGVTVRASEEEHADLFWALRGGGGNFGVVTEFEFRLHPVGPLVQIDMLFWSEEQGDGALRVAGEALSRLPKNTSAMIVGLNAPPAPFVPSRHHFTPGYALALVGFGDDDEHARLVHDIAAELPPLFTFTSPIPYVGLQQLLDDLMPWGILAYEKSLYVEELSDGLITKVEQYMRLKRSPRSLLILFPLRGAFCAVSEDATAFGGARERSLVVNIAGLATDVSTFDDERSWVREFWSAIADHSNGRGGYVNLMAERSPDQVLQAYGDKNYRRLVQVKSVYDRANIFHGNANIHLD